MIKFPVKIKNSDVNVEGPSNIRSINGIVLDEYLPRVNRNRFYIIARIFCNIICYFIFAGCFESRLCSRLRHKWI